MNRRPRADLPTIDVKADPVLGLCYVVRRIRGMKGEVLKVAEMPLPARPRKSFCARVMGERRTAKVGGQERWE